MLKNPAEWQFVKGNEREMQNIAVQSVFFFLLFLELDFLIGCWSELISNGLDCETKEFCCHKKDECAHLHADLS